MDGRSVGGGGFSPARGILPSCYCGWCVGYRAGDLSEMAVEKSDNETHLSVERGIFLRDRDHRCSDVYSVQRRFSQRVRNLGRNRHSRKCGIRHGVLVCEPLDGRIIEKIAAA